MKSFKFQVSSFKKKGFSLIEIIFASTLFLLLSSALIGGLLYGQESTQLAGSRSRAIFLAEEGLEALRVIRDENFASLADGTYGLNTNGNRWNLSGVSDTTDGFTRSATISTLDADTKQITTTVTWQQNLQRQGSVSLTSILSNWHAISQTQAEIVTVDVSSASLSGDNKELRNISLENTSGADITFTAMTVSWTNESRKIERIRIDDETVWSKIGPGTPTDLQSSGTRLDIQDYVLESHENEQIDNIKFNGSMTGQTITIQFEFGDGSTKTTTVF